MKEKRKYSKVIVTKKGKEWLKKGNLWLYSSDKINIVGNYKNGDIVDVFDEKNTYLGTGFINDKSQILVRIITKNATDKIDDEFFKRRVKYAIDYRRDVMKGKDFLCMRCIFGEADGFSGLTVDRYNNILVSECVCLGMDKIKEKVFRALIEYFEEIGEKIDGVYERNDSKARSLEGLELYKGWCINDNSLDTITYITENDITYKVDIENGQKTGFFLDQKFNREAIAEIAEDKTVLDCFTCNGTFALNAAKGGAKSVTAVDISKLAIANAKENAIQNSLEKNMNFVVADVFEYLDSVKKGEYDFIILDPPAFTKSRKTIENAKKGYKEINKKAMNLLKRGGYLATCSCSHFMDNKKFEEMLREAAYECGISLKQIEVRTQSKDHPVLWNASETSYLKFYIFQIV